MEDLDKHKTVNAKINGEKQTENTSRHWSPHWSFREDCKCTVKQK